jgi:transcriptional regulator with XRE-family HTH domain
MFNPEKVRELIKQNGKTLKEASEMMDIKTSTLTNNILTSGSNPTSLNIEKIADFLKVPIDDLFSRNIAIDYYGHYNQDGIVAEKTGLYTVTINNYEKIIEMLERENKTLRDNNHQKQEIINGFLSGQIINLSDKTE